MRASLGWSPNARLAGLRRFALGITLFNVLGHFYLGFEQSYAQPLVALAATYSTELLLEWIAAWREKRKSRFSGGIGPLMDFLLSAHISGLAVGMLLYANDRLWPIAFAGATAIASKSLFRVMLEGRERHIFNPSNLGITLTLLVFPWVGIAPAYMFTENISGSADWILVGTIVVIGGLLNSKVTRRLPLIVGWLAAFVLQSYVRSILTETSFVAGLVPMTGVAFILFTFYMVTDPSTTPRTSRGQLLFGAWVALVYGVLMSLHIVFGLFFALTIVCTLRYVWFWISEHLGDSKASLATVEQA